MPFGTKDKIKLSIWIVRHLVANPTKNGNLPDDRQCLKFIALCKSQALNPFAGDAYLVGYEGRNGPEFSMITAHQSFLKRAELHPEYDGMESGVVVKSREGQRLDREGDFLEDGDALLGGWAVVYFKNRSHPMRKRLNLSRRRKNTKNWDDDTPGMIVKCAEADALRSSFPTSLGGLLIDGEALSGEAVEPAPGLPVGRLSLRAAPPAEAGPAPDDAPLTQEDMARQDLLDDLQRRLESAETAAQVRAVGKEADEKADFLGGWVQQVHAACAAREQSLAEATGGDAAE